MNLILKNIKQVKYIVESEKSTIKDLTYEKEILYGFDPCQIKLLHNGKFLEDQKTIEEYQIKEENIIIMMNTKQKSKPSPSPFEQPKPASQKKEEQPKHEEQPKKREKNSSRKNNQSQIILNKFLL